MASSRRIAPFLAASAVGLGLAAGALTVAPAASAAPASAAPTPSSWIDTVNWYRSMAHVAPVVEDASWSSGLTKHLTYLHDTPASLKTGAYASAHTENPASPVYTADGAAAGASADIYFGAVPSEQATVDAWMAAPFHAIGILRSNLQRAGYAATSTGAALDVIRGLDGPAATEPVLWPGDGSQVALSQAGPESPSPLESCPGFAAPAGLPLIALLPTDPGAGTTATLRLPDGRTLRQGADLCVITPSTFHSSDATYGPAAESVLHGDHAVVIIPRAPLQPGSYAATLTVPGRPALSWSFTQNPAARPPAPAAALPGQYNPVVGQRLLDTRTGTGVAAGKIAPGQTVRLAIGGRAVPTGTEAVVLNITATEPDAAGYVTVFPCGSAPLASNLNFRAGETIANLTIVGLDASGAVCLTSMSRAHVIADLNGFFPGDAGFHGTVPARLLDTRAGVGAPAGALAAGAVVALAVTGRSRGRRARRRQRHRAQRDRHRARCRRLRDGVALRPADAGGVEPQRRWRRHGPEPRDRPDQLRRHGVPRHDERPAAPGRRRGLVRSRCALPRRQPDPPAGHPLAGWGARVAAGQTVELPVTAAAGDATAAVMNVTAAGSEGAGFVTVWPCGSPRPNASNLNVGAGDTRPNLVVSKVGDGGRICLFASTATHLIVDFEGSFGAIDASRHRPGGGTSARARSASSRTSSAPSSRSALAIASRRSSSAARSAAPNTTEPPLRR